MRHAGANADPKERKYATELEAETSAVHVEQQARQHEINITRTGSSRRLHGEMGQRVNHDTHWCQAKCSGPDHYENKHATTRSRTTGANAFTKTCGALAHAAADAATAAPAQIDRATACVYVALVTSMTRAPARAARVHMGDKVANKNTSAD